jgi:SIR2-like domain
MADKPVTNHNVYILGAGFSADGGVPLVKDFLEKMADSVEWLYEHGRDVEAQAVRRVFKFRLRAAGAAYRARINVDNIEELFSLASASEGERLADDVTIAIAATIDFARSSANLSKCSLEIKEILDESGQWQRRKEKYSTYRLYAGVLSGALCDNSAEGKNTIITFNYDTLLEDGLRELEVPFNYGLPINSTNYPHSATVNRLFPNALPIYKLHGSVNWGIGTDDKDKINIYTNYIEARNAGAKILLIPPTWRKFFGGHIANVWAKAVKALSTATRVIVIGFSMPATDTHFKYLLAAGLQNNISLRNFLFINPGFRVETESKLLRRNLFAILRNGLEKRGILKMEGMYTHEYLLSNKNLEVIKRKYQSDFLTITFEGKSQIQIYNQHI